MKLNRAEIAVILFTAAYTIGFFAYFASAGNLEFVWYVVTLAVLAALVAWVHASARLPGPLLWALSLWGLAHMAGGGLIVGDGVLYKLVLIPIVGEGERTILKYDQLVHFYGFAVTAWLLWHMLRAHFPALRGTRTIYIYPALGSMGLGTANEIVEFIAVLSFSETNVGGYDNLALDLVFNAAGAVAAMIVARLVSRAHQTAA